MKATQIKMRPGYGYSQNTKEIDEIYLVGTSECGFYKKEAVHNHLKEHPGTIQVNIFPYPDLLPATSIYGEKYVRSEPNDTPRDNLLKLPRI